MKHGTNCLKRLQADYMADDSGISLNIDAIVEGWWAQVIIGAQVGTGLQCGPRVTTK